MYFDSLQAMMTMEGHGIYVWTAYLVCALVVAALLVAPVRRHGRFLRQLAGDARRAQGPRQADTPGEN